MFIPLIPRACKFTTYGLFLTGLFFVHLAAQENTNLAAKPESEKTKEKAPETQTVALPDTQEAADDENEIIFLMDDFVVSAEDDQGYYSANTLAGTRTNELTKNIPMTISTVNKDLIEDFGMQTLADMGNYVPSIESEGSAYNNGKSV